MRSVQACMLFAIVTLLAGCYGPFSSHRSTHDRADDGAHLQSTYYDAHGMTQSHSHRGHRGQSTRVKQ